MTDDSEVMEAIGWLNMRRKDYEVRNIHHLVKYIDALITAASRPMPEVVTVEEQEIADIIAKSFSSKVSSETCEAAAHNLSVFFPNGLIIKGVRNEKNNTRFQKRS